MSMTRDDLSELKKLKTFKGVIVSGSMIPVINVGETIEVEVGNLDLKRFDIVVFFSKDRLICHYVWRMNRIVKPILIQTRSLSGGLDLPIALEDYLGKVTNFQLSGWQKFKILFNLKI